MRFLLANLSTNNDSNCKELKYRYAEVYNKTEKEGGRP